MFGRTVNFGVVTLVLGALGVVAQTAADQAYREKIKLCSGSIVPNIQPVFRWEYDDTTYFNVTYGYDPAYCDSTMTVNSVLLNDFANGGSYPCTRQQFAANRNTLYSECRAFDR